MGRKFFGKSGASMMEVMIAVVVAAALSAVAAPNWQKAADKKKADRALAALMTISECIKQYKVEYRLTSHPSITYVNLEAAGCFSSKDYPSGFSIPGGAWGASIPNGGAVVVQSTGDTRRVCVSDIGNLDASAPVYFIDGPGPNSGVAGAVVLTEDNCKAGYTGYYRRVGEDQIGKQRGG